MDKDDLQDEIETLKENIMSLTNIDFEIRQDWKCRIEDIQDEIDNEIEKLENEESENEDED